MRKLSCLSHLLLTTAVQISRFSGCLDALSPLISMSAWAISRSGSRLGTVLSKLALAGSQKPKGPHALAGSGDFGPLAGRWVGARTTHGAVAVQYGDFENLIWTSLVTNPCCSVAGHPPIPRLGATFQTYAGGSEPLLAQATRTSPGA